MISSLKNTDINNLFDNYNDKNNLEKLIKNKEEIQQEMEINLNEKNKLENVLLENEEKLQNENINNINNKKIENDINDFLNEIQLQEINQMKEKNEYKEMKKEQNDIQKTIDTINNEINTLQSKKYDSIPNKKQNIKKEKELVEITNDKVNNIEVKLKKCNENITIITENLNKNIELIGTMKENFKIKKKSQKEVNTLLDSYKFSVTEMNNKQKEYLNEMKENNNNVILLNRMNNDTNNEIIKLKERINVLQYELQNIYNRNDLEIISLKEDIDTKNNIIDIYSKKVHENELKYIENIDNEKKLKEYQINKNNELKEKINDLEIERKNKQLYIRTQEGELINNKKDIEKLNSSISKLENIINSDNTKILSIQKELNIEMEIKIKLENQLKTYKSNYDSIIEKNKSIENKMNEIILSKNKDLGMINEKEQDIKNLKININQLQENLRNKTNILNNIDSDIAKLKSTLNDYQQENNVLKENIKKKNENIRNLNETIKNNIKDIESKNETIESLKDKNVEIQKQINKHKDNLNIVIHNGQQLFNDISLKTNDYLFQFENYINNRLPEIENEYTDELNTFTKICKTTIDLKTNDMINELEQHFDENSNILQNNYEISIKKIEEKSKNLELLEIELNNKIKQYEMYDTCNVDKTKIINEYNDFINKKKMELINFKQNISDIELINKKFRTLDSNTSLRSIIEKSNNLDKLKVRVDDIMDRQIKHLEKMYQNSNVNLDDKIVNMESNIFKLTFAFIVQICMVLFIWIF